MSDSLERYDAGFLAAYGGGDVVWWHNYLREELDRSHEFYANEIERLRAIVDKLPKTADGVPVVPGMDLYTPSDSSADGVLIAKQVACFADSQEIYQCFYSTREAAEAAGGAG